MRDEDLVKDIDDNQQQLISICSLEKNDFN